MKRALITAAATAAIAAALAFWAYSLPASYRFQHQVDIIAQQRMVFVFIGELKRWKEWTKWAARDPGMANEYSEPGWGEGATYRWRSFWMPNGEVKVSRFQAESLMAYEMKQEGLEPSQWEFRLGPAQRQGTTVTWTVEGRYPENRFWRLIAYLKMWRLDGDLRKGLDRLKKHAELHEAYDVFGGWETPRKPPVPPQPAMPQPKSGSGQ